MLSAGEIMQLVQSLIWLLAGVGVFIVGMNFMGDALESDNLNYVLQLYTEYYEKQRVSVAGEE